MNIWIYIYGMPDDAILEILYILIKLQSKVIYGSTENIREAEKVHWFQSLNLQLLLHTRINFKKFIIYFKLMVIFTNQLTLSSF